MGFGREPRLPAIPKSIGDLKGSWATTRDGFEACLVLVQVGVGFLGRPVGLVRPSVQRRLARSGGLLRAGAAGEPGEAGLAAEPVAGEPVHARRLSRAGGSDRAG